MANLATMSETSESIERALAAIRKLLQEARAKGITGDAVARVQHNTGGIVGKKLSLEWHEK